MKEMIGNMAFWIIIIALVVVAVTIAVYYEIKQTKGMDDFR